MAFGVSPLIPAYGRVYNSQRDVLAAFNSNVEFQTADGRITTKKELKQMNITDVNVRYGKNLEKVTNLYDEFQKE